MVACPHPPLPSSYQEWLNMLGDSQLVRCDVCREWTSAGTYYKQSKHKAMLVQETLTKENFWNEMMAEYPKAMKLFCDWIDEYKESVNWNILFNSSVYKFAPKFHEIPYAMQQGIWITFANETLNDLFEQPEYTYHSFDLEEDIKTVFSEIEDLEEVES